jgi:dCMP deaminase
MTYRPPLNDVLVEMAQSLSKRAACTRRQVAALVVDLDGRIVASGYNGTPAGEVNCSDGGCPRGKMTYEELAAFSSYDNCNGIHAEANALLRAGERARGATLVVTCEPCHECARLVKAAGISQVILPK